MYISIAYIYVGRHVYMYNIGTHITCMHAKYTCMYMDIYVGRHAWGYMCSCMDMNTHYTHTYVVVDECINVQMSVYLYTLYIFKHLDMYISRHI